MTGTCPRCGRDGLRTSPVNERIPRHKPASAEHARADGYCTGSGAWAREGAPVSHVAQLAGAYGRRHR